MTCMLRRMESTVAIGLELEILTYYRFNYHEVRGSPAHCEMVASLYDSFLLPLTWPTYGGHLCRHLKHGMHDSEPP
jgi:hypothetical protein